MSTPVRQISGISDKELDAQELMARGFGRDALRLLMRVAPEEARLGGGEERRQRSADASWISLQLALCYALLGMDRDATEWCVQAEREAASIANRDERVAQIRCLRLWLTVLHGRLDNSLDVVQTLFANTAGSADIQTLGLCALVLYALKSDHVRFARRLIGLAPAAIDKESLSAAVLDLCSAEVSFREILSELPQFEGAIETRELLDDPQQRQRCTKTRTLRLAEQIEFVESRLRCWPLLQEIATGLRLAVKNLLLQFEGQLPRMGALELRIGALGNRGLTSLHRHGRFLLSFLNLHQGRTTVAEAWLCDGMPLQRWIKHADAHELLILANGRGQVHDWSNSLNLYRAYVRVVAQRAETMLSLAAIVSHQGPYTLAWTGAQPAVPPAGEITPALIAASASMASRGTLQAVSDRRAGDSRRTTNAVRDLIESDLSRPLLVGDIAASLGIARRTIENRVRVESGCSVKRFVTELRLQHAYRLVLDRGPVDAHVLQSIAVQVGFSSYRAFCSAYTRSFGRIPHKRGRPRHDAW